MSSRIKALPSFKKFLPLSSALISMVSSLAFADVDCSNGICYDTDCYASAFGTTFATTTAGFEFDYSFTDQQLTGYFDANLNLVNGLCTVPAGYELTVPDGPENCALALGNSTYFDSNNIEHAFVDPSNTTLLGLPFNLDDVAVACYGAADIGSTTLRASCIFNFMTLTVNQGSSSIDAFNYCNSGDSAIDFVPYDTSAPVVYSGSSSLKGTLSTAITALTVAFGLSFI